MSSDQSPLILAYSGGLDTSFCVPWLKQTYGRDVITATIDTGGIDASTAEDLERRALALGAIEHVRVDARESFFNDVIRHLIAAMYYAVARIRYASEPSAACKPPGLHNSR